MASPPQPEPVPVDDPLAEQIRELWAEHDRFIAEGGDPDEALDRFAEEFFDSDEATEVLLEFVRGKISGAGFAWDDDQPANDERSRMVDLQAHRLGPR